MDRKRALFLVVVATFAVTIACHRDEPAPVVDLPPGAQPETERPSVAEPDVQAPVTLDQGWDDSTREAFWFTPQGSQVLPYAWFLALERAGSAEKLRSAANMERYRYIPMPPSKSNPDGLPLGFTRDVDVETGAVSVGLTCAACHTSKLELGGQEVIVDGGPTLADFKMFLHELNLALRQTHDDMARFERFASAVLGETASEADKKALREELGARTTDLVSRETNDKTAVAYGYARLDAFGGILNNVAATGLGIPGNAATPDAPVSYPFVWDAPQADRVQWNGSALNAPVVGGLIRNIGEVLGVFGRLRITPAAKLSPSKGYDNSVNLENLGRLENWLRELWSPQWPKDLLPPVDAALAAKGKTLYAQQCVSCHSLLESRDPARRFEARMVPIDDVGTDPTMAGNYLNRKAKTGMLAGQRLMILAGKELGPETRTFEIVVNGVVGVLLRHPLVAAKVGIADVKHARKLAKLAPESAPSMADDAAAMTGLKERLEGYAKELELFDATTRSYKARPLNGIWATAPYLHNGSVPSLWELLQAPDARVKTFHVGSRKLDPRDVGLDSTPSDGTFALDTTLHGNSNAGHAYGTTLGDDEKWALIEYLKTL